MAADPLVPVKTPFNYNLGINYETFVNGRTGRSITADLNAITKNFGLIKTFHDVGNPGGANPVIDPDQLQVIKYVAQSKNLQLVMGTYTSALAKGGYGTPWSGPGSMTEAGYTDKWVQMLVKSFGSTKAVKDHLKMIVLGNELDQADNHPPDVNTYLGWFRTAFDNLSASLKKAGLGSIPVTTTIAAYTRTDAGAPIAVGATQYIYQHWSSSWNGGKPIVLFNDYTPSNEHGQFASPEFQPVINYYKELYGKLGSKLAPFVGETGYSSFYTLANEIRVYNQIKTWLNGQYNRNAHKTIPLFIFNAFDQPSKGGLEQQFGIYADNTRNHRPTGLKKGLTLPSWSRGQILAGGLLGASGSGLNQLSGDVGSDTVTYDGIAGSVVTDLRAQAGYVDGTLVDRYESVENVAGGDGTNTLIGDDGSNVLMGGDGHDYLYGLGGNDILSGGAAPTGSVNQLWGGDGSDTASYSEVTGTVYADLRIQAAFVDGVLTDQMNSIENLVGGSGVNTLVGDSGVNVLSGGDSTDYLYGLEGDDFLIGGAAPVGAPNQLWGGDGSDTASYTDTIGAVHADLGAQAAYVDGALVDQMNSIENVVGSLNNDVLVGDANANVLTGALGADVLWGKGGADSFVYLAYDDSNLVTGYDTIADFVSGTSTLDLSALATDASHVAVVSGATSTSLYVQQIAGSFNPDTDLAISFIGSNAIQMSDLKF
jgi:Ca2+-binding RTX toxin-like protein